ncbi:hypothetical protein BO86DRAFT_447469 [Aspergillus japonicus CBS 114.51]|uniref:Rhodopsin domain-containing protein n=1 Tax=Aspergillus japonicus CBS 114.51 TaxID=1448312 RepID=A0A8T8X4K9_ASPJA|nr:hypothetical protein BO86DRAFT_447469 [Aspergillus japonicus CBS 114.51]RAH82874.1 hypothetical protein BO86DRAFT_447469 [Aspergillus japonicus CBS 114.51]
MSRTYATPAAIITISILFPVLGTLTVVLRFYARKRSRAVLWIDDWLTLPALLLEYTLAALLLWGATTESLGGHLPPPADPSPGSYLFSTSYQQIRLLQIQYFADIATVFAFGFTKLSILCFYRSIFCSRLTTRTVFHTVTMFMIALVTVWTLVFGVCAIFLCGSRPEHAWATVAVIAEKCSLQLPLLEGYAISDFIMDIIIWLLPLPRIWSLNMSVRRRLLLGLIFLVGLLAIAASATRMIIYITHVVNAFAESDGETLITYLLFWTMVECGLGVIVICLPSLRSVYSTMGFCSLVNGLKSLLHRNSTSTTSGATRLNSLSTSVNSTSSYLTLSHIWLSGRTKTSTTVGRNALVSGSPLGSERTIHTREEVEFATLESR